MLPTQILAISCPPFGDADIMRLAPAPMPRPQPGEVLIKIAAAGINRADLMQRQGKYPPPVGTGDILGMEVSGSVVALGDGAHKWKIGDKVCALLAAGGYADYVSVPEAHCLPVPENVTLTEAAALPEAIVTVYANLFEAAALKPGESVLIHGGSSGIGTMAIQMAKLRGAKIFTTGGSADKCDFCLRLGADVVIDYHTTDFVAAIQAATDNHGVDVILDMVGGDYIGRNLQCLAPRGRHVNIATQRGTKSEIDMRLIMQKQLTLTGSTLRGRDRAEKARLIAAVGAEIWPAVAAGKIKPVIYQTFPLKNAAEAHKVMESGAHMGKMVLEVS